MMRSTAFAAEFRVDGRVDREARLRGGQRHAHRLEVAHLAHEQGVGVLADGRLDPLGEARDVGADLALREDGLVVGVDELDRVLDRDHVCASRLFMRSRIAASVVDLPAAGRAGHEISPRWTA
jgi:hypothetical protein